MEEDLTTVNTDQKIGSHSTSVGGEAKIGHQKVSLKLETQLELIITLFPLPILLVYRHAIIYHYTSCAVHGAFTSTSLCCISQFYGC